MEVFSIAKVFKVFEYSRTPLFSGFQDIMPCEVGAGHYLKVM